LCFLQAGSVADAPGLVHVVAEGFLDLPGGLFKTLGCEPLQAFIALRKDIYPNCGKSRDSPEGKALPSGRMGASTGSVSSCFVMIYHYFMPAALVSGIIHSPGLRSLT
jgi:hypothetical protein